MTSADHSKAVVLLLIHCLLLPPLFCRGLCLVPVLLCITYISVISSLAVISLGKREMVTLLLLSFNGT